MRFKPFLFYFQRPAVNRPWLNRPLARAVAEVDAGVEDGVILVLDDEDNEDAGDVGEKDAPTAEDDSSSDEDNSVRAAVRRAHRKVLCLILVMILFPC